MGMGLSHLVHPCPCTTREASMIKLRLLMGLALSIGTFLITATPVLAEFQSLPTKAQTSSGKSTVLKLGEFIGRNSKGEVDERFSCTAAHTTISWTIRSTGKASEDLPVPTKHSQNGGHICNSKSSGKPRKATAQPKLAVSNYQIPWNHASYNSIKNQVILIM